MKTLPKYWVVEKTEDNEVLFKQTVIQYLLDTYEEYWRGDSYRFYGYDGNSDFKGTNGWNSISKFENNPTLLTLEEFIKLTKKQGMIKEEFVLPEKWAVARNEENYRVLNDWCNSHNGVAGTTEPNGYIHSHNYGNNWKGFDSGHYYANFKQKHPDHTEITFEQFKKYVLKQEEEVMKYTLDELVGNESVVVYIDSEEEWNKLKETGKFNMCKYYGKHCYSLATATYSSASTKTSADGYKNVKIITINQIKFNETMNKEIIGYKLKKDCQQYLEAAEKIASILPGRKESLERYLEKSQWGVFKENLEKAGVLNLWFEPIYKERPKYKVGDWVLTSNNANGWGSSSGEINNKILQISRIDYDDLATHGGRYYFGIKRTAGEEIVRLATPKEIKKATTKKFPIGDYKAVVKDGNIIIDGKGKISVEAFNDFYDSYLHNTFTAVDNYDIVLTDATIKIGCVKNVTLEQVRELYNYTKTL